MIQSTLPLKDCPKTSFGTFEINELVHFLLACPYCNSDSIIKRALRDNRQYDIQRYLREDCDNRFSFNIGFEKMRTITWAKRYQVNWNSVRPQTDIANMTATEKYGVKIEGENKCIRIIRKGSPERQNE